MFDRFGSASILASGVIIERAVTTPPKRQQQLDSTESDLEYTGRF